jgi:hypothetical protein
MRCFGDCINQLIIIFQVEFLSIVEQQTVDHLATMLVAVGVKVSKKAQKIELVTRFVEVMESRNTAAPRGQSCREAVATPATAVIPAPPAEHALNVTPSSPREHMYGMDHITIIANQGSYCVIFKCLCWFHSCV